MAAHVIIDDFIDDFQGFRDHCMGLDYAGMVNDIDGVFYPNVTNDIPLSVVDEVFGKVESQVGRPVECTAIFLRQSPEGVDCPHEAHTDLEMGQIALMVYLNDVSECLGGTSFVRHVDTGMETHPINQAQVDLWEKDCNTFDKWQMSDMVEMRPNRACLFEARYMHRALPVGGFGKGSSSRLVLTAFFK